MINKKNILLGLLLMILPFISLSPLNYNLSYFFQWDYIIICLFYLSKKSKNIGLVYGIYAGLFFDTMVSPRLGFFCIYFISVFLFFHIIKRIFKTHSPVSAFFSVLTSKILSMPFLYLLSKLLRLEMIPFQLSDYLLNSLGTAILACLLYYFIGKNYKEYQYER